MEEPGILDKIAAPLWRPVFIAEDRDTWHQCVGIKKKNPHPHSRHQQFSGPGNFLVPEITRKLVLFWILDITTSLFDTARISRPLDALRKTDKFEWSAEVEEAFETLKNKLTSDHILVCPRFDRPFLVTCDAPDTALGGVPSQLDDQQRERPISFCSKALKGAEQNYSALNREALAINFTLDRNRFFLLTREIIIQSDHQPLKYLFNKSGLNSRQAICVEGLMELKVKGH